MQVQFFKIASSLSEKLKVTYDCFIKIKSSVRKYRRFYLSDIYLYIMSEEKVKCRVALLKIKKIIVSQTSGEIVLLSDDKSILIDSLLIRSKVIRGVREGNQKIEIITAKEPLLDDYVEGQKQDQKQERLILDLTRLKNAYVEFNNQNKKTFDELYKIDEILYKDEYYSLVVVSETKLREEVRRKKKKEEKNRYTVKIYHKSLLKKHQFLVQNIMNQKIFLEEIMSPYFPVLHRCMLSKTFAYCMTELYVGQNLEHYMKNETISKNTLKLLLGQIATGLGQLHECGIAYNNVSTKTIFINDKGFVVFNDVSLCKRIESGNLGLRMGEEESEEKEKMLGVVDEPADLDWLNFGKLAYQLKEGKKWREGDQIPEYKNKELTTLMEGLLMKNPEKRLGHKNDYYEVLNHDFFKGLNKKELATQTSEPLKKFFKMNYSLANKDKRIQSLLEDEDWSIHDVLLKDYEFSRQLQD